MRLPDDLPHEPILKAARPYLGPFVSEAIDWSPGSDEPDDPAGWRLPRFMADTSLAQEARSSRSETHDPGRFLPHAGSEAPRPGASIAREGSL